MEAVVQELLTIENQQYNESNQSKTKQYKGGSKKRHIWSNVMAEKLKIHKILLATQKQSRQKNKRKQCETTITNLIKKDKLSDDISMEITPIPKTQRNDVWNKYQNKVINTIKKINKQMHTRERTKWRDQMKYYKNKREEQRKSQGE